MCSPRAGRCIKPISWASLPTSPWLSLQGSGPREAAQLPRAEEAWCWTPATPPNISDHRARAQRWEQSSLLTWPARPPGALSGEQAVRWALNCPGDGRRSLLLVVGCCPGGDAELTLSVLYSHTHNVKIHSALLSLLDTIRKRHWHLCKGQSFFLGWKISALLCSTFPAQLFPENRLSWEALVSGRYPSWEEGSTPSTPRSASLDTTSPGQEGKRPALCLRVLLFPCKTLPLVKQQRRT